MEQITGGVTAAKGFQAASTAAGIKYKDRKDMAMIYSEVPCRAAGTFTTNIVKAAPVKWDHSVVYSSKAAQAVVINAPASIADKTSPLLFILIPPPGFYLFCLFFLSLYRKMKHNIFLFS